ncbi:MAG: hypothetical protein IT486_08240, partial [Gammaproteobacteria bacterium]|nr:hypothetical protein [Gammaproteobacteria bacterium]
MILLFAALSVSAPARSAPPAAVLTASDGWAGMLFGGDIAGSGDIVVIGAASPDAAAYVFRRPVGGWSGSLVEVAKLVPSDPIASQYLGHSVAIDGDTIVVSAAGPTFGPTARPGAAYVYVRPAGGWAGTLTETAKLVASDGS